MTLSGRRNLALLFIIIPAFVFQGCMTFRISPKKLDQFFKMNKVEGKLDKITSQGRTIHYAHAGDTSKPLVLFIHGSPGSMSAFTGYLVDTVLLKHARLASTDRPGFGYSNFGVAEPSLDKQAFLMAEVIRQFPRYQKVVLVGHSLGGPLVAKVAMDYPELVDGIVIAAGAVDPDLEPNETWFRAPLSTPFLSWILPRSLRSSNEELYQLKPQLQKMVPHWKKITCRVSVVHGTRDSLVPYGNVKFIRNMVVNAPVRYYTIDGGSHFIPWENREIVRQSVIDLLNTLVETNQITMNR